MAKVEDLPAVKIHVAPSVHAGDPARNLVKYGVVPIDDAGEIAYESTEAEILDQLGHIAEALDLRRQRINTYLGPVFVLRSAKCKANRVRRAVIDQRGAE